MSGTTDYAAFGSVRAQSGTGSTFGFTGEQTDASTGNVFLRARYHNPSTGRFLSADTVQPNAPGTQGYNRYSYTANNPATWTDPSGHEATVAEMGNAAVTNLLNRIMVVMSATAAEAAPVAAAPNYAGAAFNAITAAEAILLVPIIDAIVFDFLIIIELLSAMTLVAFIGMIVGIVIFFVAVLMAATLLYILGLMFVLMDPWNFFPDILAPSDLAPALANEDIGTLVTTYPAEPDWNTCAQGALENVAEEIVWITVFAHFYTSGANGSAYASSDILTAAIVGCMVGGGGDGSNKKTHPAWDDMKGKEHNVPGTPYRHNRNPKRTRLYYAIDKSGHGGPHMEVYNGKGYPIGRVDIDGANWTPFTKQEASNRKRIDVN